jgi:hypothetical protein
MNRQGTLMTEDTCCPNCRSPKVFSGKVFNWLGFGPPLYFRPRDIRFTVITEADVKLPGSRFTACAECGLIWSAIEAKKLRTILNKSGTKKAKHALGEQ